MKAQGLQTFRFSKLFKNITARCTWNRKMDQKRMVIF